jgi:hypothetical protein
MRTVSPAMKFGLTALVSASSITLLAQTPLAPTPQATVYIADGGTREMLESIFIPPLPRAPFTLTLDTEWTRSLANGGTYTVANTRRIMRDSTGRIYQERWFLIPKNGKVEPKMNYIQISDPATHTLTNCLVEAKRCYLQPYGGSTTTAYQPAAAPSGPLPSGNGYHLHEDLGHNEVAGLDTTGYRETTTLNPGVFGNDQPMVTTREFRYSAQLGINLLSKLDSPQSGKQQFTVKELTTAEPDPQSFTPPEGFSIIDQRNTQPPTN